MYPPFIIVNFREIKVPIEINVNLLSVHARNQQQASCEDGEQRSGFPDERGLVLAHEPTAFLFPRLCCRADWLRWLVKKIDSNTGIEIQNIHESEHLALKTSEQRCATVWPINAFSSFLTRAGA